MRGVGRHVFQHGELPLVVLALVARGPVHGYELMGELGRLLGPDYEPSPGSVYPALAALVSEGLVSSEGDGPRKRTYRTTAKGRTVLAKKRSALRAFEVRTGVRLGTEDVHSAIERFAARIALIAEHVDPGELDAELDRVATALERRRPSRKPTERSRRG